MKLVACIVNNLALSGTHQIAPTKKKLRIMRAYYQATNKKLFGSIYQAGFP